MVTTSLFNQQLGPASSRDQQEIDNFSAQADSWWDPSGPFAPLHRLNPTRVRILADLFAGHFCRSLGETGPFSGLSLTDVGCGGGLVTEPFARLGFDVIGLDASEENIATARGHAEVSGLKIAYHVGAPEDKNSPDGPFDAVVALEVVEHVSDIRTFIDSLTEKVGPNGILVLSTINRTLKSMALAKLAAEYILRWVPAGTHTWSKFVKPSELTHHLSHSGFTVRAIQGMGYDLATGEWQPCDDVSVNYVIAAVRT
ncbi:MAG: bifunctional 2-polyprenyl-6-hydroxyphenol methylase/3-demethylubiquinol 3-O-methyltransferase UbiG [Rhodospirillaceae bacterium]|nr:bifunctional 2-polyprenyl-6-hydroxyphenol methylase/3-demethylubiquinol 3-O-methyltransferase UbiG [Rhodospirillaceae bacterium]